MRCEECKVEMDESVATAGKPYRYEACGLDNVLLVGVGVYRCRRCGGEVPVIPRLEELHRAISLAVVQKAGALLGQEIRFLRKHAGFPARQFAALLGVSPEHLSRVENGHTSKLGGSADRLARAIAVVVRDGEAARRALLEIAGRLERKGRRREDRRVFELRRRHWRRAA